MANVHPQECEAAGIDDDEVKRITRGLEKYVKQANKLGMTVFGGTDTLSLRYDDGGNGHLVLSEISGSVSGGDGGASEEEDGLMRAEY